MRDDFTASLRSACSRRRWHFINNLIPCQCSIFYVAKVTLLTRSRALSTMRYR
nr:gluconate 5-dehydrogenase [Yersinia mollaretii]